MTLIGSGYKSLYRMPTTSAVSNAPVDIDSRDESRSVAALSFRCIIFINCSGAWALLLELIALVSTQAAHGWDCTHV